MSNTLVLGAPLKVESAQELIRVGVTEIVGCGWPMHFAGNSYVEWREWVQLSGAGVSGGAGGWVSSYGGVGGAGGEGRPR